MAIRQLLSTRLGERRWTQTDLFRKTGIRKATIFEMYHELNERINLKHLELMCVAIGCDISDLLKLEPDNMGNFRQSESSGIQLYQIHKGVVTNGDQLFLIREIERNAMDTLEAF